MPSASEEALRTDGPADGSLLRHLSTLELALRWNMSPRSLERWRMQGHGPHYIRLARKVVYRLADVEAFEFAQRHDGAGKRVGKDRTR